MRRQRGAGGSRRTTIIAHDGETRNRHSDK